MNARLPVALQCELKPTDPFHVSWQWLGVRWGGWLSRGRCRRAGSKPANGPGQLGGGMTSALPGAGLQLPSLDLGAWSLSVGKAQILGAPWRESCAPELLTAAASSSRLPLVPGPPLGKAPSLRCLPHFGPDLVLPERPHPHPSVSQCLSLHQRHRPEADPRGRLHGHRPSRSS